MKQIGRIILFSAILCCVSLMGKAQDSLGTKITYDLTAETAVGTGDYTAYQLVTNRHHILATRPNTAYLRGAVNVEHNFTPDLKLTSAVDMVASVHADHKTYLQQAYMNLQYKKFFIEAGSREIEPLLRDPLLSTGSFAKGTNSKPVPQVRIGTDGFWTVPYTKGWLEISLECGFGKYTDGGYREDVFYQNRAVNSSYTSGIYYHQKHFYFRSNPNWVVYVTAGLEHVAQFGGTQYSYDSDGNLITKTKPHDLKAFWDILLKKEDKNYFENGAMEDWVYGNHLGIITYQISWNIDKQHLLEAYLDVPFEDGSGMRKGNGWDGLWGLRYKSKKPGIQYVRGAVFEYFQTTNQSGPLHWDKGDYPEPVRSQITELVTGNDDYYNHLFYNGYAYYGMTPGNALIPSPIYNQDGYSGYRDNRIKAWHIGIQGDITDRLSYLVKGSYREGWGTYNVPLTTKHHSFDAMFQGTYNLGPWQFSAAYAFDKGNIYGDCSTFNFKIGYHGKIL